MRSVYYPVYSPCVARSELYTRRDTSGTLLVYSLHCSSNVAFYKEDPHCPACKRELSQFDFADGGGSTGQG